MSFIAKIYRHIIKRRLPYGLFSWRFLLPRQSESVCFHRHLTMAYLPQVPRLLFFPIMLFMGFKWALLYSPYYTFKAVRHRGGILKDEIGLSLHQQFWQVLTVSMGHGLAPAEWYRYRLYQNHPQNNLWDYVYDQEVGAFHAYRNRGRPHYQEHATLLADKLKFEQVLEQHGIPTTDTLAMIPQNTLNFRLQLEALVKQHGELFCKRRTGNQGRGAFRVFVEEGELKFQPRGRSELGEGEVDNFLHYNIRQKDYLIQPNYTNHPNLKTYTENYLHPASTVRIISRYYKGKALPEFAVMHWPVIDAGRQVKFYYPIAIQVGSGRLNKTSPIWPRNSLDNTQLLTLKSLLEALSDCYSLPHWEETLLLSCAAHSLVKGVDRIAWDFILTEKQAILLEGNSGWGELVICQNFGLSMLKP